jgi:hypothetical protein
MHELMHALVLTRKLWAGPLDDEFVVHVVDDVLLPVLQRGQAPDRRLEPRRPEPPGDAVTHLTG